MNNQNDSGFLLYGMLFYSNKCDFCKKVRPIIYTNGLGHYIQEICVDNMPEDQIAQYGLRLVPTLVVIYENKMQCVKNKTIFESNEVFEWVEQRILQRRDMLKNSSEHTRQNIINENIMKKKEDNIHDYHPLETGGQSDIYSYWFKDINKDNGLAQPKSFLPYGQDDTYSIATYNEKNSHKYKLNENETKKLMYQMENDRKLQSEKIMEFNQTKQLLVAKKKLGML